MNFRIHYTIENIWKYNCVAYHFIKRCVVWLDLRSRWTIPHLNTTFHNIYIRSQRFWDCFSNKRIMSIQTSLIRFRLLSKSGTSRCIQKYWRFGQWSRWIVGNLQSAINIIMLKPKTVKAYIPAIDDVAKDFIKQ